MKLLLVIILTLISTDPSRITAANTLKKEAENNYLNGDYKQAIKNYHLLTDSLEVEDPAIRLNMAHAYYQDGDTASAKTYYNQLAGSGPKEMKSIALQQLGVMSKDAGNLKESLQQLKSSIKANPYNQEARYNYEVVKKLLENKSKNEGENDDKKDIEPSEYAKALKKQSDELRYQGRFQRAYDLMVEGYRQDKTVEAYEDYIKKLQKVLIGEE